MALDSRGSSASEWAVRSGDHDYDAALRLRPMVASSLFGKGLAEIAKR